MARILHVTECYGGGVGHAVRTIARLLPGHEHHILWSGEETPAPDDGFAGAVEFSPSAVARIADVRRAIRDLQPDVVHAHSSWAGIYARMLPQRIPVIYQPHAYIVAKPDLPVWKRQLFHSVERYLTRNTDLVITLTAAEERLAKSLSATTLTARIPNVSILRPQEAITRPFICLPSRPIVVMSGRVCAQKDPGFLVRVRQLVHARMPDVEIVWMGDGDDSLKQDLRDGGVRVTGWLDQDGICSLLREASVYLHTAIYEGFPLAVLEAAAFGLPIVVRDIPAFEDADLVRGKDEQECADHLLRLLSDAAFWQDALARTAALDVNSQPEAQTSALDTIYSSLARTPEGDLELGARPSYAMQNRNVVRRAH